MVLSLFDQAAFGLGLVLRAWLFLFFGLVHLLLFTFFGFADIGFLGCWTTLRRIWLVYSDTS